MLVLGLCGRLAGAERLLSYLLRELPDQDMRMLVARPDGQSMPSFGARIAYDLLRLLIRARLRISLLKRVSVTSDTFGSAGLARRVAAMHADVGLHAANVIYRLPLIRSFRLGILNAHIGLLPEYRGRSVFEWSVINGDPAGVSTFFIDEGIDTGERIVLREVVDLSAFDDLDDAKHHLFSLDAAMYAKAISSLSLDETRLERQQPSEGRRWYVMSNLLRGAASEVFRVEHEYVDTLKSSAADTDQGGTRGSRR